MRDISENISFSFHDSEFNLYTYEKYAAKGNYSRNKGFRNALVIPIVRNYGITGIGKKEVKNYRIGFVGRFVPNKKIEDLVTLLFILKKIDKRYRLVLIGKLNPVFGMYYDSLLRAISSLGLGESVEIHGNLNDEDASAILSGLDFYVSMSEHEGFGIPVLEAFAAGVPVLAYHSTAIPKTMRGGGILFRQKKIPYLAEMIDLINSRKGLKNKIVESQFKALEYYNTFPFREKIQEMIQAVQIEN